MRTLWEAIQDNDEDILSQRKREFEANVQKFICAYVQIRDHTGVFHANPSDFDIIDGVVHFKKKTALGILVKTVYRFPNYIRFANVGQSLELYDCRFEEAGVSHLLDDISDEAAAEVIEIHFKRNSRVTSFGDLRKFKNLYILDITDNSSLKVDAKKLPKLKSASNNRNGLIIKNNKND